MNCKYLFREDIFALCSPFIPLLLMAADDVNEIFHLYNGSDCVFTKLDKAKVESFHKFAI